jgi:protein TonB
MFEQSLLVNGARRNNGWSFAASITAQSVLVGAALVLPLAHIARLETRPPDTLYMPRPVGLEVAQVKPAHVGSSTSTSALHTGQKFRPFVAPTNIRSHIATGPDLPDAPIYALAPPGGSGISNGLDLPGAVDLGGKALAPPPPQPEPVHRAAQSVAPEGPVKVGGGVQSAKLIFGPRPVYPPFARQARISGSVHLAALISADGRIRDLRTMTGHPMLIPAAIEAVEKWVYKPTLLNGQPVEVITDIVVNFVLNQ